MIDDDWWLMWWAIQKWLMLNALRVTFSCWWMSCKSFFISSVRHFQSTCWGPISYHRCIWGALWRGLYTPPSSANHPLPLYSSELQEQLPHRRPDSDHRRQRLPAVPHPLEQWGERVAPPSGSYEKRLCLPNGSDWRKSVMFTQSRENDGRIK